MHKTAGDQPEPAKEPVNPAFESNPFKVILEGMNRLFALNQTPALWILGATFLLTVVQFFFNLPTSDTSMETQDLPLSAILIASAAAVVVMTMLSTVIWSISNYVAYKTSKGESTTMREAWSVTFDKFWTILGTSILIQLKIFGGLLLFIVPGVRAILRYQMVLFPVFEHNDGPVKSMRRIKELTRGHLLEVFGIMTLAGLVPFVSLILQMAGEAVLYEQLKTLKASGAPKPPTHWLNYLGFYLFALVLVFIAMIVGLIFLVASMPES